MGKFARGKEAEEIKLFKSDVLVRPIKVKPKPKSSIIRLEKSNPKEQFTVEEIPDNYDMNPSLHEVVVVSEGASEKVKPGDLVIISAGFGFGLTRGLGDFILVDKEMLLRVPSEDIVCIVNYYRDRIDLGKVIKK